MEQKLMSIHDFVKGDIITRIIPSKPRPIFGGDISVKDSRFIGKPYTFLGIANGCIYIDKKEEKFIDTKDANEEIGGMIEMFNTFLSFNKEGPINLILEYWDEGWSYYIDPYSIGNKNNIKTKESVELLEKKLKIALKEEEYEEASKIRTQIKKMIKK